MSEAASVQHPERVPRRRRLLAALLVVGCVLLGSGVMQMMNARPRGFTYSLQWDVSGVEVSPEGWLLLEADAQVRVDAFELVTYSVELMPCPSGEAASNRAASRAIEALLRAVESRAYAGHSSERNDIATPYSVIERPLVRPITVLAPTMSTPGDWCRVHWLVARRDADTVLQGDERLAERRSLLITGARRSGEEAEWVPFEVSTTLGNGRYFDLPESFRETDTGHVQITRSAGALLATLMTERSERETEREILQVLFDAASVSSGGGHR